jgi:hypothetical protein
MDSNLLKEAIADAKAVRQTALANAKVALEEAFSEKYSKMFAEKLKEEAEQEPAAHAVADEATGGVSEQEIDELIKELEAEVGGEEGAAAPMDAGVPPAPAAPPVPPAVPGEVPPGCPPPAPAVPGLPGLPGAPVGAVPPAPVAPPLPPAVGGEFPPAPVGAVPPAAPAAPAPFGDVPPSDVPAVSGEEDMDEDINLDELLQSLKEEIEDDECEDEDEETIDEQTKLASSGIGGHKAGGSANKAPASAAKSSSKVESGGIRQEGVPSPEGTKVGPEDATTAPRPNQAKNATSTNLSTPSKGGESGPALKASRPNSDGSIDGTSKLNEENKSLKKQLNEAHEALKYVKDQLNEINLLNAKLLYTNKLFKEYNMNNEHKMRVVEMFDLSKNVREVKLTYANIAESLNFSGTEIKRKARASSSAQSITEGLASQPVGGTKPSRELISEGKANQMVTRFQQIAGIKPTKK